MEEDAVEEKPKWILRALDGGRGGKCELLQLLRSGEE